MEHKACGCGALLGPIEARGETCNDCLDKMAECRKERARALLAGINAINVRAGMTLEDFEGQQERGRMLGYSLTLRAIMAELQPPAPAPVPGVVHWTTVDSARRAVDLGASLLEEGYSVHIRACGCNSPDCYDWKVARWSAPDLAEPACEQAVPDA